jgi:ABC-type transporter Mla subunit MlaD
MSEDAFRWAITIGVALSWLMTAAMAGAMFGMYRTTKRLEERVNPLVDKAGTILDKARSVTEEAEPKIREMIARATEITVSAREQMARVDALVTETAEKARAQIDHIDAVVDDTVARVQETTAAVQTTILKPVREVNGVVSGLRAAFSTLARGNRASVDHATQDEEMFI